MKRWMLGPWILAGLLMVSMTGCDDFGAGDERFVFQEPLTFRFAFGADTLQVGQTTVLNAITEADLTQALQDKGFTPADVSVAEMVSGKLEVLFPLSEPISFLQETSLAMTGQAGTPIQIATQDVFPADGADEVSLAVLSGQNGSALAAHIAGPNFGAQLGIRPATLTPGEEYELAVELTIRLEIDISETP